MTLAADGRPVLPLDAFAAGHLPRGRKQGLWLHALDGPDGPVLLPALAAAGRRDGPTLLAVAGVHGDEYEGMEAIRGTFDRLDVDRMVGTFVGIPVANPFAYAARARCAPPAIDGHNLARVFPGDPLGSPSQVLAHHLLGLVERNVGADDLFVDLHSGTAGVAFATLVGFRDLPGPARDRSEEAARRFGLPRLWRIPDAPGPFNAETARRGIPTVGTETTGRAGCDREDVAAFAAGLTNLLAFLGILADAPPPVRYDGPALPTVDLLAPADGFLRAERALHDEVTRGDRLGTIVSLFGEPIAGVDAPVGGSLWSWLATPPVRAGELIGMIAVEDGPRADRAPDPKGGAWSTRCVPARRRGRPSTTRSGCGRSSTAAGRRPRSAAA